MHPTRTRRSGCLHWVCITLGVIPTRARGDQRVGRRGVIHVGEELDLEVGPLGAVFLNEVGSLERLLHRCRK